MSELYIGCWLKKVRMAHSGYPAVGIVSKLQGTLRKQTVREKKNRIKCFPASSHSAVPKPVSLPTTRFNVQLMRPFIFLLDILLVKVRIDIRE